MPWPRCHLEAPITVLLPLWGSMENAMQSFLKKHHLLRQEVKLWFTLGRGTAFWAFHEWEPVTVSNLTALRPPSGTVGAASAYSPGADHMGVS